MLVCFVLTYFNFFIFSNIAYCQPIISELMLKVVCKEVELKYFGITVDEACTCLQRILEDNKQPCFKISKFDYLENSLIRYPLLEHYHVFIIDNYLKSKNMCGGFHFTTKPNTKYSNYNFISHYDIWGKLLLDKSNFCSSTFHLYSIDILK